MILATRPLTPKLRPLDEKILAVLGDRGMRAEAVAAAVLGMRQRPSPEDVRTVREVLRGLECVGRAEQRGGWWRRIT